MTNDAIIQEPFVVQDIVDESGPGVGVDIAHYKEMRPDMDDAVFEALEALNEPLSEDLGDLLEQYDVIYRTPFTLFLELSTEDWYDEFGEAPPAELAGWTPVWEVFEEKLITTFEMEENDPIPSEIEEFSQNERRHPLAIRCSYANELSALGLLSEKQAQAYLLRQIGYQIARIGELMGISTGTASSHVNRAEKKVERIARTFNLLGHIQENLPTLQSVLSEREGNVYWDSNLEMHLRIVDVDKLGGAFPVYLVQYENGDESDIAPTRVDSLELVEDPEVEFPELIEFK